MKHGTVQSLRKKFALASLSHLKVNVMVHGIIPFFNGEGFAERLSVS